MTSLSLYLNKSQNFLLKLFFEQSIIKSSNNVVYLTFDDGPEPGITTFVLNELEKYNFHATFFCRGDYAEKYNNLICQIKHHGHSIGNHSYSHLHAFNASFREYIFDVAKADNILNTTLFRPPYGCITIYKFLKLRKRYRFVYWSLDSKDSTDTFNNNSKVSELISSTSSGKIVLFHFCLKHADETTKILPPYLKWLSENGFSSQAL